MAPCFPALTPFGPRLLLGPRPGKSISTAAPASQVTTHPYPHRDRHREADGVGSKPPSAFKLKRRATSFRGHVGELLNLFALGFFGGSQDVERGGGDMPFDTIGHQLAKYSARQGV